MHSFLRAIGFSKCKTYKEVNEIIEYSIRNAEERKVLDDSEAVFGLACKMFGDSFGINVFGEYNDENDDIIRDYYFPFLKGKGITTYDVPTIEKLNVGEAYAGVCEDLKVGVSLIFYLQNLMEFKNEMLADLKRYVVRGVTFSGLSNNGTILFPIAKNEYDKEVRKEANTKRMNLMAAARNGDEEAIESLTIDDIDTYSMVSRRIMSEDVYSIVETYFMPYGIECDMYSVMGDILDYRTETNDYTGETVVIMTLNCNDLVFDVCINAEDLLGEPAVGRRFKGNIWLQGEIAFEQI